MNLEDTTIRPLNKDQEKHTLISWFCWNGLYKLCSCPAGTRRNNNVFTTSTRRRRRRVDVVKTLSLRHNCVMCPLGVLFLETASHSGPPWQVVHSERPYSISITSVWYAMTIMDVTNVWDNSCRIINIASTLVLTRHTFVVWWRIAHVPDSLWVPMTTIWPMLQNYFFHW